MGHGRLTWFDIGVLVAYFAFVLVIVFWASRRKDKQTVNGYFLAGRSMLWFPVGASLFSSNIGSEHFIGLAGSGAASGIATAVFEWSAGFLLIVMGWIFLPVYISSGLLTLPEYLSKRFGGNRLRMYLSIMFLFSCVCSRISVDIYAGSVYIQQALGWNLYWSVVLVLIITALYTIVGGLTAVIFTDAFQTVVMVIGSVILAVLGFQKVGGMMALFAKYMDAIPDSIRITPNIPNITMMNSSPLLNITVANLTSHFDVFSNATSNCGHPRKDAWHLFRDPVNSDLPWPGLFIRAFVIAMWFWCGDQVIVQRAIAAKDIGHARGASIFAGYLKVLPMFLITMPGMISRVLYPNEVACVTREECLKACGNPAGCSNIAYPRLVLGLAPTGLKGLMMAVMISSMMSSLTSIFNSAATVFSMDMWPRIRKTASERESLIVGKLFIVLLVITGVSWIPLVTGYQNGQLFIYVTAVNGYFATPYCAVLLLAIFVPRVNEKGSFFGLLTGHIIGLIRMVLDFSYPAPKCGEPDTRPLVVSKVHALYFSVGHLVLSALLICVISLLTEKPSKEQVKGLTIWTAPRVQPPPSSVRDLENQKEMEYLQRETNESHRDSNSKQSGKKFHEKVENHDNIKSDVEHRNDGEETGRNHEVTRRKLYIPNWINYFLDLNAIILLVSLTLLFILFA